MFSTLFSLLYIIVVIIFLICVGQSSASAQNVTVHKNVHKWEREKYCQIDSYDTKDSDYAGTRKPEIEYENMKTINNLDHLHTYLGLNNKIPEIVVRSKINLPNAKQFEDDLEFPTETDHDNMDTTKKKETDDKPKSHNILLSIIALVIVIILLITIVLFKKVKIIKKKKTNKILRCLKFMKKNYGKIFFSIFIGALHLASCLASF